jgi:hypothetical protein
MGAVVAKIYDLQSNELADISAIALEKSLAVAHNGLRTFVITAPAGHSLLTSVVAGDGFPNLQKGDRKLIVWEDGVTNPVFHGRIQIVERNGDGTQNLATITGMDFWAEAGYDGDDRAGRYVRGGTVAGTYDGNFINPKFAGTGTGGADVLSGPDWLLQALTNSQNTGAESDPTPGEGPLPIDLTTGTFDVDVGPAIDLMPSETMSWPLAIGDLMNQLVQTGVVDIVMRPIDPSEGLDPYAMVAVSAVSASGTDRSATVHFDYFTGSKNAKGCRHVDDFQTICNKLYDYLGPPKAGGTRWTGNITPGSPGTTVDPTDSRTRYGVFHQIRIKDTTGTESSSRPLYIADWNAEQGYRIFPRDLLYITPADDAKALYQPPADFDVGDLIAINVGADFGLALADTQRVYGYTKTWSRENVASVSELLTSADAA